ncbi:MAG: MBL fold metallo-hydrolase [Pseudomonadota bacterium]
MPRSSISTIALALSYLAVTPAAIAHGGLHVAQSAQQDVTIEATDLSSGAYMLVGQGGNIGVLAGDDGVFVIDSQFANIAPRNLAKINEIADGAPTLLVNTHWHGDHTGGNANFGATIIAHDNVRARVSTDQALVLLGNERNSPAAESAAWPVITFDDDLTLHLNGQTIRVVHLPEAHTDGDSMVFMEEANVLHMGDVFFNGRFPFIDISTGGTIAGYIAALDVAYATADDDTKVIPGHGQLATREDIAASIVMLRGVNEAVLAARAEGLGVDEAVAANILSDWAEDWAPEGSFMSAETFTRIIYADLDRAEAETTAEPSPEETIDDQNSADTGEDS